MARSLPEWSPFQTLERPSRDKHSSLFDPFINKRWIYGQKDRRRVGETDRKAGRQYTNHPAYHESTNL